VSTGNQSYFDALLKAACLPSGTSRVRLATGPPAGTGRKAVMTRRPSDEELGRRVREEWVRYWIGRPGAKESYLWGWDDPRLPPEQREADIAIGRALFDHGAITAVKIRHEVDETLL
jgi:hypothetical protein